MKSSTGEKEFFSVSLFASEGKTDEVKEFTIAERTVKVCLLHFRLEYLRKCVTCLLIACNSKSVSFGSILSLVSMTGVVEVHLLGDSTIIFASCDSV